MREARTGTSKHNATRMAICAGEELFCWVGAGSSCLGGAWADSHSSYSVFLGKRRVEGFGT